MEGNRKRAARLAALVYTLISLGVALTFYVVAGALGKYTPVAIYGGTAWVFLLSMIVTMPTITPWMKRQLGD